MSDETIQPIFIAPSPEADKVKASVDPGMTNSELRDVFAAMPFTTAYDYARGLARALVEEGKGPEAVDRIGRFKDFLADTSGEATPLGNLHAALAQIHASLLIEAGDTDEAMRSAAYCLNLLAQDPKRRDEPFLSVLAALLYDIARVHTDRGEHRQAEREIEKSAKIYERLARTSPERYGPAHLLAVAAATTAFRSRVRQASMLAHFQAATGAYMEMMTTGVEGAAAKLVESLTHEGQTLARMGRHREAVQYFTRALKYLTRIEPEFTERQLLLSVDLGQSLLSIKANRQKGIHLLNTMLHKAARLNADATHRRIVEILADTRTPSIDILGFWHKIFPR